MVCASVSVMSCSSIMVTTKFSLTYDDKLRPKSVEKTTNPNRMSTKAVLIQSVTDCRRPERPLVFLRLCPISKWL